MDALAELLPLALVIAVSPIPVLAVILMLLTERSTLNASALLAGWALALTVIAAGVAALGIGTTESEPSTGVIVVQLALALLLFAGAARRWNMHRRGEGEPARSRWMERLRAIGPIGALALGFGLIALNPKDGLLTVVAGARLGQADPGGAAAVGALAAFVAVSSSTIAAPIAAELALGERADSLLERSRVWLERNGNLALAIVLLALGLLVAIDSVRSL